jgi:hypothetical protein
MLMVIIMLAGDLLGMSLTTDNMRPSSQTGCAVLTRQVSSCGLPRERVWGIRASAKSDKFLVLAHGTADEVAKAKDILQTTRRAQVALHAAVSAR